MTKENRLSNDDYEELKKIIENKGRRKKTFILKPIDGYRYIGIDDRQEIRLLSNNKKIRTIIEGMLIRGDSKEDIMSQYNLTMEQVTDSIMAYERFYTVFEE